MQISVITAAQLFLQGCSPQKMWHWKWEEAMNSEDNAKE